MIGVALADGSAFPAETDKAIATEARFADLVGRQSRFVFKVAWAILRNAHDAEDVVQDVFLKLYRGRAWERMNDERAFLARTAWRLAVDRIRLQRSEGPLETVCPAPDPERAAIAADRSSLVQRLIDGLPEGLRQPLALSAIDEMNSVEIAAAMGLREGTVRTRLMRARHILREKLAAMEGAAR